MDHSLRTISYIADIGDIVVIMARRRTMVTQSDIEMRRKRQSKILCHVFESEEVSLWRFFVCFPSKLSDVWDLSIKVNFKIITCVNEAEWEQFGCHLFCEEKFTVL